MKKQYTKKQIQEAIKHWEHILNEQFDGQYSRSKTVYIQPNSRIMTVDDLKLLAKKAIDAGKQDSQVCGLISVNDVDLACERNFIGGMINGIHSENGKCILTLAPYHNGRRNQDLSVASGNPISAKDLLSAASSFSGSMPVAVKMKDPYGTGPNAGRIVDAPVFAGKITLNSYLGIFLYISIEKASSLNESDTIHDDEISEDMELVLEMPGSNGVDIELEGDWDGVRFAADMLTDALSHMKAKNPAQYADVHLHVKRK